MLVMFIHDARVLTCLQNLVPQDTNAVEPKAVGRSRAPQEKQKD